MKQRRKKIGSLLLSLCVVMSMLPTVAFAAGNAEIPTISTQPASANYTQGDTATPLSVEASVSDSGTLSYQWYSSSSEYGQRDEITGETNSTYTPSTGELDIGTTYYYCQVKNTKENLSPSMIFSDAAEITVSAPSGGGASNAFKIEDGRTFATLQEAVAAVPYDGTITMLKDVTVSKPTLVNNEYGVVLDVDKNYIIDFGGYTLSSGDNSRIEKRLLRISAGTVTLRNGSIRANYDAAQNLRPEALSVSTTVNIHDMNIVSSYAPVLSAPNGNITIWSGKFESFGGNLTPLNEELGKIILAEGSTVVPASGWKNHSVNGGVVTVTAAADVTPPSVLSVMPEDYVAAAVSGNVVIKFSEWMDKQTFGTVQLNNSAPLTGGVWTNSTTYMIPYSSLEHSTTYTVNIYGFKDEAGNVMDAVTSGHTFTTLASVASNDLKEALRSTTTSEIAISSDITLDEVAVLGANHTLTIPAAYTLTINGKGAILMSGKTLTIKGGGTVTVARNDSLPGFGGNFGTPCEGALNFENITVNLQNSYSGGICVETVNVGNGATVNLDSATGYYLITVKEGYTLNVNNNGKIHIKNFKDSGIFNSDGTVHINGGEIVVDAGQGWNWGIDNAYYASPGLLKISNGGRLSGTDGGMIRLFANSNVEGVKGRFKDRGIVFNTDGISTVATPTAAPSENALADGKYIWNGNMFVKEGIVFSTLPQSVTVNQGNIAGSLSVTARASNNEEVSYAWSRAEWDDTSNKWINATVITDATSDSYPIPSDLTAGKYGFYVTVNATGCDSASTKSNMATVTVNPPGGQTYAATLNIRMDDSPFTSQTNTYTLKLDGSETTTVIMTGTGDTRTGNVGNGIWKIYDSSNNYTGVNITVNNAPAEATLDYYTVNYSVIKKGTTSDGRIILSAVSLGGDSFDDIVSGNNFLKGVKATFTAAGTSAESYNYVWSGTHGEETISGTESIYRINSVQGKVNITCTITGSGTVSVPVPGNSGTITVADITQNSLMLNWANATSTVQGNLKYAVFQSTSANISTASECTSHQELLLNANPSGINTYAVSGLSPNTTYYFNVVVIDDNMGMTAYTMISATTAGGGTTPTITITKHPQNITVTQGKINEILTAEAIANNGKPVHYQWRRFIGGIGSDNTQPLLGETSNTFAIPIGLTAGTYQYLCIFNTDGTDYVDSNTAIVTVKPPSGDGNNSGGSDNSGSGATGNDGNSSTGGNNTTVTTPPATTENPNPPAEVTTTVMSTISGNTVSAEVSGKTMDNAIAKAQAEVKKNSIAENGIVVKIKVDTKNTRAENIVTSLSKESIDALVKSGAKELRIISEVVDIILNLDTLKEIQKQLGSDISVTAKKMDNNTLSAEAKKIVGNRPVYDFSIADKNGKKVTDFGTGKVSVSIPYTLGANEKAANVIAYYIDSTGKIAEMPNSVYDPFTKTLSFVTDHFSKFAVGYNAVDVNFTDIANHWAKESIEFVVARGLLNGTGEGKFSPNTYMTRGMFVTVLGRLAEANTKQYTKSLFTDVKADAYYMPYVEWASKNGIVKGTGNGKFAPDQTITREQMAVIMANYAKAIGFDLPKVHAENIFADSAKIGSYAKEAVKAIQMAGVLAGKDGNKCDPQGTATRAEVSAVLKRFVELAINSDTAQGWTMNDSGKWMFYENGKAFTGTKNIDGTTYTFDKYGVTAEVPKNRNYTTYIVQKGDSFWLIAYKQGCTIKELELLNNRSRFSIIYPDDKIIVPAK